MSFKGTTVNKLNGGLDRTNPTDDGVMALACVVPALSLPGATAHNTAYELLQTTDAETLGFDAAFDANESVLIHHAVERFFGRAPEGTLILIPVPDALTQEEIMEQAAFQQALRNTKAKCLGIIGAGDEAETIDTLVEGVQAVVNTLATEKFLLDAVILQADGKAGGTTAIATYPDNRAKVAPNVSVSIAQDGGVADSDAAYGKYAEVGEILGDLAVRQVNENLGSLEILNYPEAKKGNADYRLNEADKWTEARLSDGTKVSTLSQADMKSLTDKGYIFAGSYQDYPGVYWSSSPTCVELASDYAFIENNRTWNKGARGIRNRIMPKIKGILKKDPVTGYIRPSAVTALENLAHKPLREMLGNNELSGEDVYINPKQIVNDQSPLQIKATMVKDEIIHEINIDLGYSNSL